ncbi:unnamed protein product [Mytilus edulis]|uniref:Integrase catalytic domain-containing protein n=1 Tax=Mytilus edulis TaxID=6550 RepID=A0A8S3R2Q2_MYTED|nr:unnamed protein product [Mytilus edulis]
MTLESKNYLVTVDYYSYYWEVDYLEDTLVLTVIRKLRAQFARHGIPDVCFTDNGPQFDCGEFRKFSRLWEFKHDTSSPLYSQSNGKNGDTVKIQPSNFNTEWKKGTIKQQVNIRSYEVDVGTRTIRRNRRQLKHTLEEDNNEPTEIERDNSDFEHGEINNQDNSENATEIENAKETPIITRSGKVVKPPARFKDCVCE